MRWRYLPLAREPNEMCAKSMAAAPPRPSPELQALAAYQQELAARSEPHQPKEPEDPIVARFRGLILDQEEK